MSLLNNPSVHTSYFVITVILHLRCLLFSPCSIVSEEVDLQFESTSEDHAVPPAAHNDGRPSYGWVSPLPVPCH